MNEPCWQNCHIEDDAWNQAKAKLGPDADVRQLLQLAQTIKERLCRERRQAVDPRT